jgi:hypothetical protein
MSVRVNSQEDRLDDVAHPGFQGGDIAGVSSGVGSVSETDRCVRRHGPPERPRIVDIQALIDCAKCFEAIRGMRCPECGSAEA